MISNSKNSLSISKSHEIYTKFKEDDISSEQNPRSEFNINNSFYSELLHNSNYENLEQNLYQVYTAGDISTHEYV